MSRWSAANSTKSKRNPLYFFNLNRPNNDYQIIFDKVDALIQKVDGDTDIMVNKFAFAKLSSIDGLENNSTIDLAAYIKEVRQPTEVTLKKSSEQKQRRVITLYDNSNTLVEMVMNQFCFDIHHSRLSGETLPPKICRQIRWS